MGRVLGFGLLGGILGLFGSVIHFSSLFLGATTVLVGVVMLLLGLSLTNLSPRLGSLSPKLPKFLGRNVTGDGTSKTSTVLTGAATFFLPCGFTLAMQAYAVTTGSFVTGALVLALFAIGTMPGLLSIGLISAILRGEWLKKFFTFTGVVVLILGAFNVNNGYALLSVGLPSSTPTESADTVNLEVQEVRMTQDDSGYTPSTLSIDAGKKIRWIITGKNPYSCSSQIMVPALGISRSLQSGENIIEFVAPKSGEIPFSCSMGMYRGRLVVNTNAKSTSVSGTTPPTIAQTKSAPVSTGSSGASSPVTGCPMMRGSTTAAPTSASSSTTSQTIPSDAKTIGMTYTTK